MAKYIDPFTDTGFKIVFGKEHESNEILRQFLNALFEKDPGFSHIESVEYRPSERTREWTEDKEPIGGYMRYVFIQLPAFQKEADECEDKFEQWIYNLTHMKTMETMQFTSHQEVFNRLARVGNLATLSPSERSMYEYDLKKARDYHAELEYARKLAMKEGRAEGRAEGIEEGKLEVVRNMIKKGLPLADIASWTGISPSILESLSE